MTAAYDETTGGRGGDGTGLRVPGSTARMKDFLGSITARWEANAWLLAPRTSLPMSGSGVESSKRPAMVVGATPSGKSPMNGYGGRTWPPGTTRGPAAGCRIEVWPFRPARMDYFLHVLTATDATVDAVAPASVTKRGAEITVSAGESSISFGTGRVGGNIEIEGKRTKFPRR